MGEGTDHVFWHNIFEIRLSRQAASTSRAVFAERAAVTFFSSINLLPGYRFLSSRRSLQVRKQGAKTRGLADGYIMQGTASTEHQK